MTSTIRAYQPIVITSTVAPGKLILDYIGPLDSDLISNGKAVVFLKTIQDSQTREYSGHRRAESVKPNCWSSLKSHYAKLRGLMRHQGGKDRNTVLATVEDARSHATSLSLMKVEAKS
ncbi:hypothetical protein [Nitrosospira sp. Is2]|uniref:hypothetical protein n=1 Tax=Nitrosospira sp. Is2 TaxID=3080532 RepID=UPI002954B7BF|nr:hypothetical protein [Nitrosospira sp. Is2]WON73546.1 hypothetical protein R5L00_13860 [Nitrosospira sp. Is2]